MLSVAASARAQDAPRIALRVFGEATAQRFSASHSFDASFGQNIQPFFGGGLQATFQDRFFVEVGASRFSKTGDQVFVNGGQVFHLGIPMTVTVTPLEIAGGYRFHPRKFAWLIPYLEGGGGSYQYRQTSTFADPSENIDTRKAGFLAAGGAEFRVHRWIGVAVDAEYTHIPGILGTSPSVSNAFGETDLGGLAGRFRIVVGK
jgi:opacity protein-like surface antigen